MRTFATISAAGLAGIVFFKLFTGLIFPILAIFIGLMALTMKLAVFAAVAFFLYSLLKKRKCDGEIEVS